MDQRSKAPAGVIAEEMPRARPSPPWTRLLVLAVLVVAACALAFGVLEAESGLSDVPREAEFGVPSSEAAVRLYLQAVQIDPVNDSLQVRISVVPDPSTAEPSTIADSMRRTRTMQQFAVKLRYDSDRGRISDALPGPIPRPKRNRHTAPPRAIHS